MTPSPLPPIAWADAQRQVSFQTWLLQLASAFQLNCDSVRPASTDASFRRYFRIDSLALSGGPPSYIIMDAPPELENSAPFVQVAQVLAQAGLRVPEVLTWEQEHGFLLMTDLGQQTMMDLLQAEPAAANQGLFLQAVDALITLQKASRPDVLPAFDAAQLRRELDLFPQWYVRRHRGIELDDRQTATLAKAFDTIIAHNLRAPNVYVHCDFMPRNLMPGSGAMGVLDFQDALYGPITYDIASLMRDAFISWEEDFVLDISIRYWEKARKAGLPVGDDFGEFYRSVEWMGLQRHLRIAGVFARLTLRDSKPRYLADAQRFIGYIRATAARYRELAPLLRLIDQIEGTQAVTGFAYGRV